MAGSVTVKDIATYADVSVGTVSRVFNNHSNVTEEIRQRVLKAATDLGYFGSSGTSSRTLKEIGFLYYSKVDNSVAATNPFWSHILDGVESEARKSGLKVTYRFIGDLCQNLQVLLTTIYEMKLGGILLVGAADPEVVRLIHSTKVPLVLVDNYIPGFSVDAVLVDNFEGARTVVEYLINAGHRDIAFIGGPTEKRGLRPINTVYTIERRASGYRTAMIDANLPLNYDRYVESNLTTEGGYEACKLLLARKHAFSAIFCANDAIAIGAMKALREAGLSVPTDVSLVGFDDISMVEHLTPALTTVRVNKEALGYVAVKSLQARCADVDAVCVTSMLETELIIRDSVVGPSPTKAE